jgi:methylated-DNA-[protein]-cysteine S-methyltransferase
MVLSKFTKAGRRKAMYLFFYDTPIGRIGISENGTAVTGLYFEGETTPPGFEIAETELLKKAGVQLQEYFSGKRKSFDLPIEPQGTPFQQKVWKALREIPYGETRTYKEIACAVGNEKASRAVGMANNKNPIALIIPCHRVVGSNRKLVGYAGGLHVKEYLLDLERRHKG